MILTAVVLTVVIAAVSAQDCPAHMHWEFCGSACPQTCDSSPFQLCAAVCLTGCVCDRGYVLNNGVCILQDDCPAKECPANSRWSDCGSACPETCEVNPFGFACLAVCVPSCVCDAGFVSHDGDCITRDQCPGDGVVSGR